jgi:amino acid adenylation domain-containing protein
MTTQNPSSGAVPPPRTERQEVLDAFPATPTQAGMVVSVLRDPRRGVEFEQVVVRFEAHVELAGLREALASAQRRFGALRSRFRWEEGSLVQEVLREAPLPFAILEPRPEDHAPAPDGALEALLREDRERGFDHAVAPLFRATVLRRPRADVLVLSFHHAILDGRSYRRVLEHLLDRLDGRGAGGGDVEEPTCGDYCRALAARDLSESRAYFAHALLGASSTPLPFGASARAQAADARGHRETVRRIPDVSAALELARAAEGSLAHVVQAAWAWTLARCARIDDVVVGTTRAGRIPGVADVDRLVGCLIDTLPLRVRVDEDEPALRFVAHVRGRNHALRPHEHTPLTEVLSDARLALSSLVVFERYDLEPALRARGGPDAARGFALHERSDFPLVLAAYQDGTSLRLALEHDPRVVDDGDAQLLLERVELAIARLAAAPDRPLRTLDLFAEGEEARLRAWARGPLAGRTDAPPSITARLAEVARARRDHGAVRDAQGESLSHRELLERAERVASALVAAGAAPGSPVLCVLPRSIPWVVGMWAAWLADAVYVPLDPAWPAARIAQVHEDLSRGAGGSRPVLALVDARTRTLAESALAGARILSIDDAWDHSLAPSSSELAFDPEAVSGDPLAYVLFTSGSTGRPKGSRIGHRALAAHAEGAIAAFGLTASDRVLQFTSLGFDVSIEEVVPTLLAGGKVVLRSEESARDPARLLDEVARAGVTVLNLPSAYFHELVLHLEATRSALPRSVRLVVVGGERPSPETYARFARLFGDASPSGRRPLVRFVNAYGPTEVTITSVLCDAAADGVPPDGRSEIPIGRPFGRCRAHVVRVPLATARGGPSAPASEGAHLAAIEEPGELWLAGPQVAAGYLDRPDDTARAFVPDPFAAPDDVERTAYRTGDLVKIDRRGRLVFLGRIDRQIKLRGHRIEPGEIEAALQRLPGVREAAVVAVGEAEAKALVAFVSSTGPAPQPAALGPDALRDALAASLPSIMVPAKVVLLDALPVAPTGKVDRDALARLGAAHAREPAASTEPRDDVEAWLRAVFSDVLGREELDLERSFFEQGGHSLSAIRVVSRLAAERPDLSVSLATLFAHPSVRSLGRALREGSAELAPTLVRLSPRRDDVAGELPVFCVCGVQLYGPLARAMEADRPVFGAFLPVEAEAVGGGGPALDVVSMASAYLELVRRERPRGPYVLAGVSFGGLLAYEMAQQLRARGEDVPLLALFDTILPRAIEPAPLASRALLHLDRIRRGSEDLLGLVRRRLERVQARARAAIGGADEETPGERDEAIRDDVLKAAGEAYDRVVTPYEGRVVIFRARGGLGYEGELVRWDMGWSGLVRPDTAVHGVEGDHLGILREPGVSEIARILRGYLATS